MARISGWGVVLMLVFTAPIGADYEAGERAWNAERYDQALTEWHAAAASGDRRAMLTLGRLYVQGLGAPQDYVEAHKWLSLAASRGETEAVKERDSLAVKMTPEQVATAQERAVMWRAKLGGTDRKDDDSLARPDAAPAHVDPPPPRAIREAQRLLAALGYAPGSADGVWGKRSTEAYRAFLRDAGIVASETLTPEALRTMRTVVKRRGVKVPSKPDRPGSSQIQLQPDALHRAARKGDVSGLKAALEGGADVNARDGRGWTALMHAANMGYSPLVELLLKSQADPDLQAPDGATALFMAALHRHIEIIALLVKAGAEISIQGPKGRTALEVARIHDDPAIDKALGIAALQPQCTGQTSGYCWQPISGRPNCFALLIAKRRSEVKLNWSGTCVGAKASGKGNFTWSFREGGKLESGSYIGEFRNGSPDGHGKITLSNGHQFDGQWLDGKLHRGVKTWPDGSRYVGQFLNYMAHGEGEVRYANGQRYEGQFLNDKRHGHGTFTWPDGSRYEGQWANDKRNGVGTYTSPDGYRYVGQYRDDKAHGNGKVQYANGDRYEGQLMNDRNHGRGTYFWVNGHRYDGEWRNGGRHGVGTMICPAGERHTGQWANDFFRGPQGTQNPWRPCPG